MPTPDGKTMLPPRDMVYNQYRRYQLQSCVMFIDTQMERDIDLGSKYKFDPMTEGQCLINNYQAASLQIEQGDILYA